MFLFKIYAVILNFIHPKNPEKKYFSVSTKIFSNCFQQNNRMISEGSRDTEDWSNAANSSLSSQE